MRIVFISVPEPRELRDGDEFEVGQVYDLRTDLAERWKLYGRAVDAPPEEIEAQPSEPMPEPAPAEEPVAEPAVADTTDQPQTNGRGRR